jgi:DNA-directed RNA polymerase subunit RPC12/RpoP
MTFSHCKKCGRLLEEVKQDIAFALCPDCRFRIKEEEV